jgi:hypothetical protein
MPLAVEEVAVLGDGKLQNVVVVAVAAVFRSIFEKLWKESE